MFNTETYHFDYLLNDAQSLLARLKQLKPFSLTMPMVKGASVSSKALKEIVLMLENSKNVLRKSISEYISQIESERQQPNHEPEQLYQLFAIKKLILVECRKLRL